MPVLVRKDGSKFQATPEQAERLKVLGYREESVEEEASRIQGEADKDYYEDQKGKTFVEGVGSGLSLGLTDQFLLDEHGRRRAEYNPGTRMAGEITGMVGASLIPGVGAAVPAAAAVRGARTLGAFAGAGARRAAVTGAAEGAAFGLGGAISQSAINNEPLTIEGALHGMGFGALIGGSVSALGSKVAAYGEKVGAKLAKADEVVISGAEEAAERANYAARQDYFNNLERQGKAYTESLGAARTTHDDLVSAGRKAHDDLVATKRKAHDDLVAAERKAHEDLVASKRKAYDEGMAAYTASKSAADDMVTVTKGEWGALRSEVAGLKKEVAKTVAVADDAVANARSAFIEQAELAGLPPYTAQTLWTRSEKTFRSALEAAKSGKGTKLDDALAAHAAVADEVAAALGPSANNPVKALEDLARLNAAARELHLFPQTAEAFIGMKGDKFERVVAALEAVRGTQAAATAIGAVDTRTVEFAKRLGVDATDLPGIRKAIASTLDAAKKAKQPAPFKEPVFKGRAFKEPAPFKEPAFKEPKAPTLGRMPKVVKPAKEAVEAPAAAGSPGLLRRGVGWAAGGVAYTKTLAFTRSPAAALAAASTVRGAVRNGNILGGLVAAKNNSIARVQRAAANYLPKAGKGVAKHGGKASWLAVRLDGTLDDSSKDPQQLAQNRIDEVWTMAGAMPDRLYKAVEPLAITEPAAAEAMHATALAAFRELQMVLPKDPGVVSAFQPIWRPSPTQAGVMAKQLRVFHDPVGAAEEMLATGDLDPISIGMLKRVAPAIYQELRVGVINRLSDPAVQKDLTYNGMVGISTLIDLPFHSSMRPEQIAASQARFAVRNEPLPTPSIPGQNTQDPTKNPLATQAQRLNER